MTLFTVGRYEVEKELGRGGMAVVYLARDPAMKRLVAIKILQSDAATEQEYRTRFRREVEAIASLEHPAIVPIYDYGEYNHQVFIVMRYMAGGSLLGRMTQDHLSGPQLAPIFEQLCSALEAAHEQGMVHRDIKPANILFDQWQKAHLADFGIVKLAEPHTSLRTTGVLGTPAYMSPEQARGLVTLDGRSDLYSLGVVLFEVLTGQLPFKADTPMGLAVAHITEPVPDVCIVCSDLPAAWRTFFYKALAKEPDERYASAREFALDLNKVAGADTFVPVPNALSIEGGPSPVPEPALPPEDPNIISRENVEMISLLSTIRGHNSRVSGLDISADGKVMISGGESVRVWNGKGHFLRNISHTRHDDIWCLTFLRGPEHSFVAGSRNGHLRAWNADTGQLFWSFEDNFLSGIRCVAASLDGKTLACGTNARLYWWGLSPTLAAPRISEAHRSWATGISFSPDSTLAAVSRGYPDSGVQIWDVAEAKVITHLKHVGIDWAYSTTFSPDGKMLASAADDGQIRIWDTSTWALLSVLKGHMGGVMALQYSPSGKLLTSGGQDNTIRLWDAERLEFLCALGGHADAVECLIFNPEGTRLMSSGKDQLIRVWGKEI